MTEFTDKNVPGHQVSASGVQVTYDVRNPEPYSKLYQAHQDLGLEKHVVAKRSHHQALVSAVTAKDRARGRLVRPTKKRESVVLVRENRGYDDNQYTSEYHAELNSSGEIMVNGELTDPRVSDLQREFDTQKELATTSMIAKTITGVLQNAFKGTRSLRSSGGVYWLPPSERTKMHEYAKKMDEYGLAYVEPITAVVDPFSIRAIIDALVLQVSAARDDMLDAIAKGSTGHAKYAERVADLRAKVDAYREALGESLGAVDDAIKDCSEATAAKLIAAFDV